MEIGPMRSRITIQRSSITKDAIGNHLTEWVDFHTCFAYANLASGKEYQAAGQTLDGGTLVFTIRWCDRLRKLDTTGFRIQFEGSIYNITCVDDVQFRHERLKLTAEIVRR